MSLNRLPAEFRDESADAVGDAVSPPTIELSDRGRDSLEILNDLFDSDGFDEPADSECGCG